MSEEEISKQVMIPSDKFLQVTYACNSSLASTISKIIKWKAQGVPQ